MSNPDTNNIGIKLQIAGENLNTWGDPNLNNDFIVVSNLASKFNSITINGDYNVGSNSTNYSTTNPDEVALIKLIPGTVTAAFNFVMAGRAKRVLVWNTAGFAAQMKLAATTGFSLASGCIAMVTTDGITDVYNSSPTQLAGALTVAGQIHGVVTPTAITDAANKTYVDTAIATAALPATAGTVLNSGSDTTAGYLSQKVTATLGGLTTTQLAGLTTLQISTVHPGGVEQTLFTYGAGYVGGLLDGGSQTAQFTPVIGRTYDCDFTASSWTINFSGMTTPQIGQSFEINAFGPFAPFLLGTVNGQANFVWSGQDVKKFKWTGSSQGWN